eukprot:217348-Pelagomonas_calceolata.AAC.1
MAKRTIAKRIPQCVLAEWAPSSEHAAIIDLDGNGWSDRFHTLTHYNTPVLKQQSTKSEVQDSDCFCVRDV